MQFATGVAAGRTGTRPPKEPCCIDAPVVHVNGTNTTASYGTNYLSQLKFRIDSNTQSVLPGWLVLKTKTQFMASRKAARQTVCG